MSEHPVDNKALEKRKKIGQYLLEEGLIEKSDLNSALDDQRTHSDKLGRLLIDKNLVTDVQLARALALQHHLPFLRLKDVEIKKEILHLVPPKLARLHGLIPVRITKEHLLIATAFPSEYYEMEKDIRFVVQMRIKAVVAPEKDIFWALDTYYPISRPLAEEKPQDISFKDIEAISQDQTAEVSVEDIEKVAGLPPVVRFTNSILAEGIMMGASDLHLEPQKDQALVRFRIDGIMRPILRTKRKNHLPIVSRIKILSGLDISIRRHPQDGKAQIRYGDKVYDLRVSTLPTYYGEKVAIRVLDPAVSRLLPEDLGLSRNHLKQLLQAIHHPDGLIVVTGPTGSGKTSTLYACLNARNTPEVNIVTVEDPVEFDVQGINQVQIHPKAGVNFAAALRSILRQDPDIVMVGEIRDGETAEIAMQAAQTGHLVLSTLHTNDAPSALTRLMDLSVEPYLIASGLILVVAQRLVRKICPYCKIESKPDPEILHQVEPLLGSSSPVFWEGSGCEQCNQTGYKGRMGIFEILEMTPFLQSEVTSDPAGSQFNPKARLEGYRTMFEDGLDKALQGLTTLSEIFRVAPPQLEDQEEHSSPLAQDLPAPHTEPTVAPTQPVAPTQKDPSHWQVDRTPAFKDEEPSPPSRELSTVLVVDDSKEILLVLERTLEKENLQVITAENAEIGLVLAKKHRPDLIITDYKMPIMDGFAFIKELKKDHDLGSIPIIMLTAKDSVDTEVEVLGAGADDYVVKPVERKRFVARVKRLLNLKSH